MFAWKFSKMLNSVVGTQDTCAHVMLLRVLLADASKGNFLQCAKKKQNHSFAQSGSIFFFSFSYNSRVWWCATVSVFSSRCRARSLVPAFAVLCFPASLFPSRPCSLFLVLRRRLRQHQTPEINSAASRWDCLVFLTFRLFCLFYIFYSPVEVVSRFPETRDSNVRPAKEGSTILIPIQFFLFFCYAACFLSKTQKQNPLSLRQTLLSLESEVSGPQLPPPFSQEKRRKHPVSILTEAWNKLLGGDVCIQAALLGRISVCPQMSAHSQVTVGHLSSAQLAALALERKTTRTPARASW